jgi:serine/threonine protein kinase
MYQMLIGKPPFRGQNDYQTFQLILHEDPTYPSEMDPTAKSFIKGLLSKNIKSRLGVGNNRFQKIRSQQFFDNFNFDDIMFMSSTPKVGRRVAKFQISQDDNILCKISFKKKNLLFSEKLILSLSSQPMLKVEDSSGMEIYFQEFIGDEIDVNSEKMFSLRMVSLLN